MEWTRVTLQMLESGEEQLVESCLTSCVDLFLWASQGPGTFCPVWREGWTCCPPWEGALERSFSPSSEGILAEDDENEPGCNRRIPGLNLSAGL